MLRLALLRAVQIDLVVNTIIQQFNLQKESMFVAWQPIIPSGS